MYNSIYPVNINYTKHNNFRKADGTSSDAQKEVSRESYQNQNFNQNSFPNGSKVAIDYSSGQINISQVLTDFRSTILAINAPDDVKDEVYIYLNLVEKESHKDEPQRDIIMANLKNASRISDTYIAQALKKPSNVVQKWIETLFLQKINLKADENEINPAFQLEFPKAAQEKIDAQNLNQANSIGENSLENSDTNEIKIVDSEQLSSKNVSSIETESEFEISEKENDNNQDAETLYVQEEAPLKTHSHSSFSPRCEADMQARNLFSQAKKMPQTNRGDFNAINLLNEALGIISKDKNANKNIKAAIHIERGKIFDNYDYVDYALRDYFEATKADDYNLKAQAHYKSAQIYDEFSEFYPAMDNYLSSVAYSAEADNSDAQTRVLSKISSLYTRRFNTPDALQYGDLAIETANQTAKPELIAQTYSKDAENSQYLGEDERALNSYKNALQIFPHKKESYSQMAYNYSQAAIVMRKLGNHAKALKLQSKANLYYQKAQLQQMQLEEVS